MNLNMRGQIIGVKKFSGNIEGKEFDYCRIIVATPLECNSGQCLRHCLPVEYNYGASAKFRTFQKSEIPD